MKNKKDVYVIVDTPKKAKKLKKVLNMFGEEFSTTDGNAIKTGSYKGSAELYAEFNKAYFTGHNWTLMPTCSEKSEVSIKELRNILAREHLKEGDVVVAGIEGSNGKWVVKFKSFVDDNLLGEYNSLEQPFKVDDTIGYFDNFIRYATEAEKELLRVNSLKEQAKGVIKPVSEELEVGKWYSLETVIICVTKLGTDGEVYGYGLNTETNTWIEEDEDPWYEHQITRKATPKEVEKALIEEAKRRGFKGGFVFDDRTNILWNQQENGEERAILSNGKWATIIEQAQFTELKEAYKNGAVIECLQSDGEWFEIENPKWQTECEYRIKPEEKPQVGDLVKAWDNDERDFIIGKLNDIDDSIYPFTVGPTGFINAKKITPQEAKELLTDYCR